MFLSVINKVITIKYMKKLLSVFALLITLSLNTNSAIAILSEEKSADAPTLSAFQKADGSVSLSWTKYLGNDFRGYKVVHSTTESEPIYPENGYLIFLTDINNLNYIHSSVKEGNNYYRICTLTSDEKICGNTVVIKSQATLEDIKIKADEYRDDESIQITLKAEKTSDNKAKLSWTRYSENDLKWYKIVRSQENEMPYYPNDGYIGINNYRDNTTYTDEKPLGGKNYYRVCVITTESKRACSNVVLLNFELSGEMPFTNYFPDTKNHWAREYINALAKLDIVSGINGNFMPENNVLRSEALKMILLSHNIKIENCDASSFSDIKSTDWFCEFATTAKKLKILEGIDGKLFPNSNLTRAEAIKILIESRGDIMSIVSINSFPDLSKDEWYASYAYHAKRLGFMQGIDGKFEGLRPITRAELAKIISISMETEQVK